MGTIAASGGSTATSPATAAKEAVRQAAAGLRGRSATFGFVFASPRYPLSEVMAAARDAARGTDLLGSTTAGEITERGRLDGGVAVLLVAADGLDHVVRFARGVKGSPATAARDLCEGFADRRNASRARGLGVSTTVLMVDGLAGTGELVVESVRQQTGALQEIVGGAAGDEGKFVGTHVASGDAHGTDAACALHAFGSQRWGIGVDHGLSPATPPMRVTRAAGNVVYELDDKPAFEVYRAYARGKGVEIDAKNAPPFLLHNELGVLVFDNLKKARAPLSVGPDGSLACAAEIPQGASVCILGGSRDALVAAAERAAKEARQRLGTRPAAGVLLFDCICRGGILAEDFGREIAAVKGVFPEAPIAGFLTYGEIARYSGRLDGWHNTTAVVAAIPG